MNTTAKKLVKNTAASLAVGFAAACALILCGCANLRENPLIVGISIFVSILYSLHE